MGSSGSRWRRSNRRATVSSYVENVFEPHDGSVPYAVWQLLTHMLEWVECEAETVKRMAIIERSELKGERDHCLTCEAFHEEDARPVDG